jgi:hypothetical protein
MNTLNNNAILRCSFGLIPMKVVLFIPRSRVMACKVPMGDITHQIPMASIPSFGMCRSMTNPMVIALTAAAMGVPTPAPCIPMTVAPWIVGNPKVLSSFLPSLKKDHKIFCAYGGCISAVIPGGMTVMQ